LFCSDRWTRLAAVAAGLLIVGCESAVSPGYEVVMTGTVTPSLGNGFSAWSAPALIEAAGGPFNTASVDGCPFISPDGKTFYMASNRAGGYGGLDIWVSTRASVDDPWGAPENMGARVNSGVDDFCPTISRDGKLLYFASRRPGCRLPGSDNDSDLYVVRLSPAARLNSDQDLEVPEMLPCDDVAPYDAVNSPYDEFSPFPQLDPGGGLVLYFSSFRPGGFAAEPAGGAPDRDLYWSASHGGAFGNAELIPAVNTAVDDGQPNVGSDGRELFFYSTRAGGVGAADLYVSTRAHPLDAWSAPANLGATVNSTAAETRPSLSWDGLSLYFGSTRAGGEGSSDIYVTSRQRLVP
jgi:hypothetical protein